MKKKVYPIMADENMTIDKERTRKLQSLYNDLYSNYNRLRDCMKDINDNYQDWQKHFEELTINIPDPKNAPSIKIQATYELISELGNMLNTFTDLYMEF